MGCDNSKHAGEPRTETKKPTN
jgi:tellurium resistance protein TerZ